jgi:hypothetical protein
MLGAGRRVEDLPVYIKKIIVAKTKEMKIGNNLAECPKRG